LAYRHFRESIVHLYSDCPEGKLIGIARREAVHDEAAMEGLEVRRGQSHTLRISRQVLEDYPPLAVLELLDRLKVAAGLRARPDARYVVVQDGLSVTLEEALG